MVESAAFEKRYPEDLGSRVRILPLPPFYKFSVLCVVCLVAKPLDRRSPRTKAPFCKDLPCSARRKGNVLVLELEVRINLF